MQTNQHQESGPEEASDDPFAVLRKHRRGVWVTTAAACALGLAVAGGAVAGAATTPSTSTSTSPSHSGFPGGRGGFPGSPPAAFGTVRTIGSNSFTLTTPDGTTVTVDVSPSTAYKEFGKSPATLADVTVGTEVVVFGTDSSNIVTATAVGIGGLGSGRSGTFHPGGPGWHPPGSDPSGSASSGSSTGTDSRTQH